MSTNPNEISPKELAEWLQRDDRPFLLDVRNAFETDIASIPGTDKLIPVDQLVARVGELDELRDKELVVYCRSGGRSGQAVQFLRHVGFARVKNLVGGTLRWADEVDPTMKKY